MAKYSNIRKFFNKKHLFQIAFSIFVLLTAECYGEKHALFLAKLFHQQNIEVNNFEIKVQRNWYVYKINDEWYSVTDVFTKKTIFEISSYKINKLNKKLDVEYFQKIKNDIENSGGYVLFKKYNGVDVIQKMRKLKSMNIYEPYIHIYIPKYELAILYYGRIDEKQDIIYQILKNIKQDE